MTMTSTASHGISLKAAHYRELLELRPNLPWAEMITENVLGRGGRPLAVLEHVRSAGEIILHGVSMSLGGLDPLDLGYLGQLRNLIKHIDPAFVSDHLSFGTVHGRHGHDLWPMPRTEEALRHLRERVLRAQDELGRPLVLENVSAYVEFRASDIPEPEFIVSLLEQTGAGMLIDINNVFVSCSNFGWDPVAYIRAIPPHLVRYMHLGGHLDCGTHLLDNHGAPVCDAVWALYELALERFGPRPTIVEWDSHVPSLNRLIEESRRAAQCAERRHGIAAGSQRGVNVQHTSARDACGPSDDGERQHRAPRETDMQWRAEEHAP